MRVGIIGTGDLARTLAHRLVRAGHEVAVAAVGGELPPTELTSGTGVRTTTLEEAVADAEVVVLAIPFRRHTELPPDLFHGKVVVDATDYYPDRDGPIAELDQRRMSSSELLARHLDGARVVKALNTTRFLAPTSAGIFADDLTPVAIPVAGDDEHAKSTVVALLLDLGYQPVEAGRLADSWRMEPGTPVHGLVSNAVAVRLALKAA